MNTSMIHGNKIYVSVFPHYHTQCWVNFRTDILNQISNNPQLDLKFDLTPLIKQELSKYNARYVEVLQGRDYVEFDSEEYITLFILKWSS
jgi:hypothetical protein